MDRRFALGMARDWGLALLAAIVIFVGWAWLFGGGGHPSGEAPDFTLDRVPGEGAVTLSEIGEPVILNFWATWCGPCKAEIPEIEAFAANASGVRVIGVSTDNGMPSGQLERWVERLGITYEVVHDRTGAVSGEWGISTVPSTFALSADGHIVDKRVGTVDRGELERMADVARDHAH